MHHHHDSNISETETERLLCSTEEGRSENRINKHDRVAVRHFEFPLVM